MGFRSAYRIAVAAVVVAAAAVDIAVAVGYSPGSVVGCGRPGVFPTMPGSQKESSHSRYMNRMSFSSRLDSHSLTWER